MRRSKNGGEYEIPVSLSPCLLPIPCTCTCIFMYTVLSVCVQGSSILVMCEYCLCVCRVAVF